MRRILPSRLLRSCAFGAFCLWHANELEWKGDVVKDRHRIEQCRSLKQHAELSPHFIELGLAEFRDILSIDQDAAAIGQQQCI